MLFTLEMHSYIFICREKQRQHVSSSLCQAVKYTRESGLCTSVLLCLACDSNKACACPQHPTRPAIVTLVFIPPKNFKDLSGDEKNWGTEGVNWVSGAVQEKVTGLRKSLQCKQIEITSKSGWRVSIQMLETYRWGWFLCSNPKSPNRQSHQCLFLNFRICPTTVDTLKLFTTALCCDDMDFLLLRNLTTYKNLFYEKTFSISAGYVADRQANLISSEWFTSAQAESTLIWLKASDWLLDSVIQGLELMSRWCILTPREERIFHSLDFNGFLWQNPAVCRRRILMSYFDEDQNSL